MILGIDPGANGGIAVFELIDGALKLERLSAMPTQAKTSGKGGKEVSPVHVSLYLAEYIGSMAYVERVTARPGQGVTGMFAFGRALGIVEGILASHHIAIEWVTPQSWKRAAGLIKKPKAASITRACELWPQWAEDLTGLGEGVCEAAMIAHYGHEK